MRVVVPLTVTCLEPTGAALPDVLTTMVSPWAAFYADHPRLATSVVAIHMVSVFVGGGMAIAADRRVALASPGTTDAVRAVIADLATTHAVVIGALVVTVLSGLGLLTADLPTFGVSVVFWIKMSTLVVLLANGLYMRRTERGALESMGGAAVHTAEMPLPFPLHAWRGLRRAAVVSFAGWVLLVLLGVLLSNV